jgi:hypothetical protein
MPKARIDRPRPLLTPWQVAIVGSGMTFVAIVLGAFAYWAIWIND